MATPANAYASTKAPSTTPKSQDQQDLAPSSRLAPARIKETLEKRKAEDELLNRAACLRVSPFHNKPSLPPSLFPSFASISPSPPCTPFAFAKNGVRKTSPFTQAATNLITTCKIRKQSHEFGIAKVSGMSGQHSQVYVLTDEKQFIEGIDNNKILIKTFKEDVIARWGSIVETRFLKNSLTQYKQLIETNQPVAIIYNVDTVLTDGYLVVERLAPLILPWDANTSIEKLSERDGSILKQLQALSSYALQNPSSIPLDLTKENLGIKEDGRCALLDFMEREEDEEFAFRWIAKKCFLSLANKNMEVYRFLRSLCEDPELFENLSFSP